VNGFPLVESSRKPIEREFLRGFVIGASQLPLVQILDGGVFLLNGYAVFRDAHRRRRAPTEPITVVLNWQPVAEAVVKRPPSVGISADVARKSACSTVS